MGILPYVDLKSTIAALHRKMPDFGVLLANRTVWN